MEQIKRRARRIAKHLSEREAKRQRVRVKTQELRRRIQEIWKRQVESLAIFYFVRVFCKRRAEGEGINRGARKGEITKKGKLTLEERQWIYLYKSWGMKIREIARKLKRAPSTISRELKKNRYSSPIFNKLNTWSQATCAHEAAKRRRSVSRRKLRLKSGEIRRGVAELLMRKDDSGGRKRKRLSPKRVAARLLIDLGLKISYQAIYEYIYFEARHLIEYLPRAGKKYRRRGEAKRTRVKKQPAAPKTSIDERPQVINDRLRFGDWEMDTIVSKQSKECLLVIQERLSRFFFVVKLNECTADCAFKAVIAVLKPLVSQDLVKSMTVDNGPENSCYERITQELNIPVYFCHPYCSSERGGVENRNGTLREFFPKKTNFSLVSVEEVENARQELIHCPMECLGFYTPYEIFYDTHLPMLKAA
jgi:transposase, IS30 family